jgi:hypothetical protein
LEIAEPADRDAENWDPGAGKAAGFLVGAMLRRDRQARGRRAADWHRRSARRHVCAGVALIQKPITSEQLAAAVRQALDQ